MEQLSVCYLAFSYYPGQGATSLFEYSRNLAKMGHNVHVIVGARSGEPAYDVVNKVVVRRIHVKTVKRRSLENIRFSCLANRTLVATIKMVPFDIVHVFSYAGSFLTRLGTNVSRRTRWIYDVRSGSVGGFPRQFFGKVVQKFESSMFDAAFVIDKAVMEATIGCKPEGKIFKAPIGVDLERFRALNSRWTLARHGVKETDIVLIYSGSLDPSRRIDNLIHAFWKALKKVKDLKLVILGEGAGFNCLKLLVKKLGISDRVFFLGYVDYREVPALLSAADIAVSYVPVTPAYDAQPPVKTIEYLACSLPVIATETVGNRCFIGHERNGLLTRDDPNSLSEAIIRLSQDEHLRKALSKRARPSVKEYDWNAIVNRRILHAYQKVLQT